MNEELIAQNIKIFRKRKRITLEKLEAMTGLTKGYLSKIERSKKAPPYSTLNRIAVALGVDPSFLLGEDLINLEDIRISFARRGEGRKVETIGSLSEGSLYGYGYEAIAFDKPGKNMEPYIIEPAFGEEAMFQHEGEELIYVLEGRHEFIYGEKKFMMEKGDSVYFDSAIPHTGRSIGKKKAKLLAIMFNYRRL